MGMMASVPNGHGVTGIAYNANIKLFVEGPNSLAYEIDNGDIPLGSILVGRVRRHKEKARSVIACTSLSLRSAEGAVVTSFLYFERFWKIAQNFTFIIFYKD